MVKRASWLSVTPEPERELPEAVAVLRHGRRPTPEAVTAERERIERLVLHGRQREWLAYLHEVVELLERPTDGDEQLARARTRATTVLANHHNLLLGLPGRAAERTAADRARLSKLADDLPRHPE
ncbi:MAG TPA: hypothetical protein VGN29_20770 [Solirubrobacteraceae bacterium]|jgi:hypothetical protein|nr:hypothetical protein [Solirubrobacteraceae bacterium]